MAQKVTVSLIDDIDGGDAKETIPFAFDGVAYEIDLNETHAVELRAAFTSYAEYARRATKGKRKAAASTVTKPTPKTMKVNGKHSPREMRDWARSNGYDIPDRGRVPQTIVDAFAAVH